MLNNELHLDESIFSDSPKMGALRDGFGKGLLEAGKQDESIVAACADLTGSTRMDLFKNEFPERFFEVGITEQHMAAFASGLASMEKLPFISSYAMFSPGRNWEQIRTTICYNDQPVIVVGSHAGVSVGPDGGTHQAIEDIALMRVLPRMTVVAPADEIQAYKATLELAKLRRPAYIRLAREKTLSFTTENTPFKIGEVYEIWRSQDPRITIFATGTSVPQALLAAKKLDDLGIGTIVINVPTIKPLDELRVLELAHETGKVITVENHQMYGGFGSAIAEVLVQNSPVPQRFVAVKDKFGQSGTPEELLEYYGLDSDSIVRVAQEFLM